MPLVSITPAELVAKFDAGVLDTVGKFAAGVDTGGNFAAILPPVSLHCKYLREFSKMTLVLFSGAWGKMIHEQNLKQKIL